MSARHSQSETGGDPQPAVGGQRQPRYAWVVMSMLWGMDAMAMMIFFSVGVLIPVWKDDLGISAFQAGLLASAGFLGFGTMALPASIWLTRYNPRKVILACSTGLAAFGAIQAIAPNVEVLLVSRFAFVLLAVSRVQTQVLFIHQWFRSRLYATANSMDFGARATAQVLATAAVPPLIFLLDGWRNLYLVVVAVLVVLSFLWLPFGRQNPDASGSAGTPGGQPAGSPGKALVRHKILWVLAAAQIGAAMAFASFMSFFPTYANESLGLTLTTAGLLISMFPVGAIFGSLSSGPLSQRLGRRKPFIWAPGITLPLIYLTLLQVDLVPVMGLLLFAAGFFAMSVPPIIATVPLDMGLPSREVAVALGLVRTLFPAGATLGPLMVGAIAESTGSLATGLIVVAPFPLTLIIGGLLLRETGPKARASAGAT